MEAAPLSEGKTGNLIVQLRAIVQLHYYGCTIEDNAIIGFRDEAFDQMFGGREAFTDYLIELDREACLKLFTEYSGLNATIY